MYGYVLNILYMYVHIVLNSYQYSLSNLNFILRTTLIYIAISKEPKRTKCQSSTNLGNLNIRVLFCLLYQNNDSDRNSMRKYC